MSKIPSFDSLRAKTIGRDPVLFKSAQGMPPDAGAPMGQGMGGVTTGRPDEMQAPESADQQQFEQDLSGMAYQFVVDRAPGLLPYMLGFEVVDRSEDGSKAVGIYGYKIDDDFYYIPVFFINNQIRGVDMILNKRTNSFIPLTEEWINYIINKHAVSLGKAAPEDVNQTLEQPNLDFLRMPQNQPGSKTASAPEEMWSLKTAWHMMKVQSEKLAESDPLLKEMFNGVLKSVKGVELKKSAEAKYINGFMRSVGGPEAQISLLKTFRNVKFANAALTFYNGMDAFSEDNLKDAYIHRQAMAKKAAAMPKLKIVTAEDIKVEDDTSTTEEEAKQILDKGFTIRDSRPPETTSDMIDDVLTVDFEKRFSTPTEVGKYSFVMEDGKLRDGYLLSLTHNMGEGPKDSTAVYFPSDKVVAIAPASAIFVDSGTQSRSNGTSYSDLFDSAKDKGSVEPCTGFGTNCSAYMFIGPRGQAIGPMKITAVFKDGDDVSYSFSEDTYNYAVKTTGFGSKPDFGSWDIHDRFHDTNGYRNEHVWVPGYDGDGTHFCSKRLRFCSGISRPTVNSKGIIIPDDWKVLEAVNVRPYNDVPMDSSEEARDAARDEAAKKREEYESKYTFGSPSCILNSLQEQGMARVKIASTGIDSFHMLVDGYHQTNGMTYKQASIVLTSRFGLPPKQAFKALDKAASAGSSRFLVTGRGHMSKQALVSPDQLPVNERNAFNSTMNDIMKAKNPKNTKGYTYNFDDNEILRYAGNARRANVLSALKRMGRGQGIKSAEMSKQAQGVGVSMPMPVPQEASVDDYTGIPTYADPYMDSQQGQFTGVPSLPPEGGLTRGIANGSEIQNGMGGAEGPQDEMIPIDQEAQALADQAAQAGQKHVFDQAAVGGLSKVYDTSAVVDSYIPNFMDSLDRLGRILFLFYWKHDDFNSRYGSDDVVEMEDRLRSVFKQLGDLTLKLKEKAVRTE